MRKEGRGVGRGEEEKEKEERGEVCVFMRRNVLRGDLNAEAQRRKDAEKERRRERGSVRIHA